MYFYIYIYIYIYYTYKYIYIIFYLFYKLDWIGFNLLSLLEYRYRGNEMARKDEDYSIT